LARNRELRKTQKARKSEKDKDGLFACPAESHRAIPYIFAEVEKPPKRREWGGGEGGIGKELTKGEWEDCKTGRFGERGVMGNEQEAFDTYYIMVYIGIK